MILLYPAGQQLVSAEVVTSPAHAFAATSADVTDTYEAADVRDNVVGDFIARHTHALLLHTAAWGAGDEQPFRFEFCEQP